MVVLTWLEPSEIGLWQTLVLIGTYLQLAQGGAIHGLGRELPFSMGQGDAEAVKEFAGTGQIVAIVSASLCLSGLPVSWFFFSTTSERLGACAVLAGTAAQLYRLYLGATYRAARSFDALARIQVIETVVAMVTLTLVYRWGFAGLAARFMVQMVGGTLLVHIFRPLRAVGKFRWERLRSLFTVGVPIFAFGYLSDVAKSFPRLVLLWLGGVTWVGLFAPASSVMGAMSMIPTAVGTYIYPQMTHTLGRTGDPSKLWPTVRTTALFSVALGVPVAVVLLVAVPYAIQRFAPGYAEAIPATQWTIAAGVFMGAGVIVNALASLKAYRPMFVVVAGRLILLLGLPLVGERLIGGITGVAVGITVAFALDLIVALVTTRIATRGQA